jgi:PAS domain S-box-containing protein
VAFVLDLTERKRAETALRASEERWRAMFAHAPTAIAMVGADYRLMETNPACHRMLGYSENEFRQLTPMDISLDDDRDVTRVLLPQLIDGTRESARTEKRYRTKDGSLVWADATFFHVPATEGSPGFATAIVVDITERKRAEEALLHTQSELARAARIMSMGELTVSIAHEVNQPLAAIVASGNACRRWLATEPPNLTRAKESLNRIVEDADRASGVITRVRAHTKNTLPEQVEVRINDIVEGVLFLTRGELEARLIMVQVELGRDVAPVLGDKVQLQQVILNLVMNAVEAMNPMTDRQRILTMKSYNVQPTEVQVMVGDNGPGLNLDDSDRIFDAFVTTKPDGMGMGLSISRSIIEAHGGRLWTSPASPRGAEFHFALPTLRARES